MDRTGITLNDDGHMMTETLTTSMRRLTLDQPSSSGISHGRMEKDWIAKDTSKGLSTSNDNDHKVTEALTTSIKELTLDQPSLSGSNHGRMEKDWTVTNNHGRMEQDRIIKDTMKGLGDDNDNYSNNSCRMIGLSRSSLLQ